MSVDAPPGHLIRIYFDLLFATRGYEPDFVPWGGVENLTLFLCPRGGTEKHSVPRGTECFFPCPPWGNPPDSSNCNLNTPKSKV